MSRQFWANLAVCVVLGSLVIFAVSRMSSALTPKGLLVGEPQPSEGAAPLMPHVRLADYLIDETGDHVYEANFRIRNNSPRDVKNIRVLCEFLDGRKEYVDRKWWLLSETVPSGSEVGLTTVAKRFINTRARISDCRIADFQLVTEPLFTLDQAAATGHGGHDGEGHGPDPAHGGGH